MNARKIIHEVYRLERDVPFAWGTSDCLCFCASVAERMLGRDPIAHLRGRYDSEISAKRVMVAEGWATLGDVAAAIFSEIHPVQTRAGDWIYVINDDGTETLGVVVSERFVARGRDRLVQDLVSRAQRAFRVAA